MMIHLYKNWEVRDVDVDGWNRTGCGPCLFWLEIACWLWSNYLDWSWPRQEGYCHLCPRSFPSSFPQGSTTVCIWNLILHLSSIANEQIVLLVNSRRSSLTVMSWSLLVVVSFLAQRDPTDPEPPSPKSVLVQELWLLFTMLSLPISSTQLRLSESVSVPRRMEARPWRLFSMRRRREVLITDSIPTLMFTRSSPVVPLSSSSHKEAPLNIKFIHASSLRVHKNGGKAQ